MYLISFPRGFRKFDGYGTFPECLDLTPFWRPGRRIVGWGGGRIGLMERKRGRREGGGEVYASAVCCCGAHWEYGASLSLFSWDQHGLMVYYSLGATALHTLRSLLNCRVGRQWIHKDGQRLLLWISVRLRNWHKASRATNEKGSGRGLTMGL